MAGFEPILCIIGSLEVHPARLTCWQCKSKHKMWTPNIHLRLENNVKSQIVFASAKAQHLFGLVCPPSYLSGRFSETSIVKWYECLIQGNTGRVRRMSISFWESNWLLARDQRCEVSWFASVHILRKFRTKIDVMCSEPRGAGFRNKHEKGIEAQYVDLQFLNH